MSKYEEWPLAGSPKRKCKVFWLSSIEQCLKESVRPGMEEAIRRSFRADPVSGSPMKRAKDLVRDVLVGVDAEGRLVCYRVLFSWHSGKLALFLKFVEQIGGD